MAAQVFNSLTVTNGSKDVVVNDSTNTGTVLGGYNLVYQNQVFELSGKTVNQLTLVGNWPGATDTISARVQSTTDPLAALIIANDEAATALGANFLELIDNLRELATTTGTVMIKDPVGVEHAIQGFLSLPAVVVAKMQESGLGPTTNILPFIADINAFNFPNGQGYISAATTGDKPPGYENNVGIIKSSALIGSDGMKQEWTLVSGAPDVDNMVEFVRYGHGGTLKWSWWVPIYTGANLNPNVFSVDGFTDFVAQGYANGTTSAHILLHLNNLAPPNSITVTNTFTVNRADGVEVASGIVPVLHSVSSAKLAVLTMNLTTPVTVGDVLTLRATSSASKIKVNV